jgi:hypothetical protein
MRHDVITAVRFGKLDETRYDRRGDIAVFTLLEVPNMNYVAYKAAIVIRSVIATLSKDYRFDTGSPGYDNIMGESQDCWINHHDDRLVVRHKYWTEDEVAAFKAIIRVLADLHKWEVTED